MLKRPFIGFRVVAFCMGLLRFVETGFAGVCSRLGLSARSALG